MRTVRTVAELREALASERRAGRSIGLVPTMGATSTTGTCCSFARLGPRTTCWCRCSSTRPKFGPGEDLEANPRDEERDTAGR